MVREQYVLFALTLDRTNFYLLFLACDRTGGSRE